MSLVTVRDLVVHSDDRGNLFEMLRNDDKEFYKFGQVYLVEDRMPFVVRAYHKHFELWDHFCITHGSGKFVFFKHEHDFDLQATNFIPSEKEEVYIDSRRPKLISVPPKVWHGWMSLEPDTQMVSIASVPYNQEKPDELRCGPYILGKEIWEIKAK